MKKPSGSAALLAAGAVLLTGCGSSSSAGSSSATSSSSAPTTSASSSPATPSSSASGSSSPAESSSSPAASSSSPAAGGPVPCRISDLRVSVRPGEGAAGSTFYPLRITNVSGRPCRTGGYVGISLVATPRGNPIGAPADRTMRGQVRPIVLKAGGRATAIVQETSAANYPAGRCRPTTATGFRVYPPDETRSAFVRNATTACAAGSVHLLTVRPLQAG